MDKIRLFILLIIVICIHIIYGGCTSDYTKRLGNGYTYRDEGGDIKDILHEFSDKGGEIPSTVVSYEYNNEFIIAKQKPKLPQDILYCKEYNYNRGDTVFYYWLIVKKDLKVLGPLDINQFNQKRKEYRVSDKLILE